MNNGTALGVYNLVGNNTQNTIAVGVANNVKDGVKNNTIIGHGNTIASNGTTVLGNNLNIAAGLDEAVVLGNHSTTTGSHTIANVTEATVGNLTYSGFKGTVVGAGSFVSVGAADDERKLINVAAGNISATSTEAINGSQLYAVTSQLDKTNETAKAAASAATSAAEVVNNNLDKIESAASAAVSSATAASNSASSAQSSATAASSSASAADSSATAASSSASAAESSATVAKEESASIKRVVKSTDENGKVNNVESEVDGNNATAVGSGAKAKGDNSSSFGTNANANGKNATAIGQGANASANNATAIGQGAKATANNSVALGQGSVANEANTVSVGSVGNERRITNVADPVRGTDAANKQYVDRSVGAVRSEMKKTDKKLRGGIAGATAAANIPQVTKPGGSMVGLGVGNYKGESAVAVGYSRASDNNKVIFKVSGAATTQGDYNVGAGVGYQW